MHQESGDPWTSMQSAPYQGPLLGGNQNNLLVLCHGRISRRFEVKYIAPPGPAGNNQRVSVKSIPRTLTVPPNVTLAMYGTTGSVIACNLHQMVRIVANAQCPYNLQVTQPYLDHVRDNLPVAKVPGTDAPFQISGRHYILPGSDAFDFHVTSSDTEYDNGVYSITSEGCYDRIMGVEKGSSLTKLLASLKSFCKDRDYTLHCAFCLSDPYTRDDWADARKTLYASLKKQYNKNIIWPPAPQIVTVEEMLPKLQGSK